MRSDEMMCVMRCDGIAYRDVYACLREEDVLRIVVVAAHRNARFDRLVDARNGLSEDVRRAICVGCQTPATDSCSAASTQ